MIIGTGVYIDDIEKEVAYQFEEAIDDLNLLMQKQKIGESGYILVFDNYLNMLVHPDLAGTNGSNLINPVTGQKILLELKDAAEFGSGYLEYMWDKPEDKDNYNYRKKAYITYFKPLGWYIGSTMYVDDYNNDISALVKSMALVSAVFIFITFISSLLISRKIGNQLSEIIEHISRKDKDGIPLNYIPDSTINEIHLLSIVINKMMDSIKESRKELKAQRDLSLGIISDAPYIIINFDSKGRIKFMNKKASEITGYNLEEVVLKEWKSFFYPQDPEGPQLPFINSISDTITDLEVPIKKKRRHALSRYMEQFYRKR